jgi:hypothetical protein
MSEGGWYIGRGSVQTGALIGREQGAPSSGPQGIKAVSPRLSSPHHSPLFNLDDSHLINQQPRNISQS